MVLTSRLNYKFRTNDGAQNPWLIFGLSDFVLVRGSCFHVIWPARSLDCHF